MKSKSIYKEVTDEIVSLLETGVKPWDCPWNKPVPDRALPYNITSEQSYSGINILALWLARHKKHYGTNGWLTFKQIQAKGGVVRKGEHGSRCIYYAQTEIEDDKSGEIKPVSFLKSYVVFNVDQVEGNNFTLPDIPQFDLSDRAEQVLQATGVKICVRGSQASYDVTNDIIVMPPKGAFNQAEGYYATLMHELVHWTGSRARLDRFDKIHKYGDANVMEELVAELGSAFLCAELGIANNYANHASYVESWLKLLKTNDKAIFIAASLASKAHKFVLPSKAC